MTNLQKNKIFWLNILIVVSVAFNLRAPITSIGPMIEALRVHFDLSSAEAGFLNTLPLLAFGSISFIVAHFSLIRAMGACLVLLLVGEFLRPFGVYGLYIGALLIGIGISIANVLLPIFIKSKFPHKTSQMMGVYSFLLSFSSIVGIALSLPLFKAFGVSYALLFWALFAFLALVIYSPYLKNGRFFRIKPKAQNNIHIFRSLTAWKITLFMGIQSFIAYALFTWYAQIIAQKGYGEEYGANIVLLAQCIGIPISLIAPILLGRLKENFRGVYILMLCSLYIVGFTLLLFFDSKVMLILSAIPIGIAWAGVFGIALLFISLKSSSVQVAAKLSSMAQGFGYLLASLSPFSIGFLYDCFSNFNTSIILLIIAGILVTIMAYLSLKSKPI
ncbi:MFS transporter [Helicobacter burdigaliensis]|uniref:MFS transporter n=1 Tax=Helicobacter burdigaliensis TaxID=2315334 RepID=UPI000EF63FF5|nr:MFS transporter [Helicobacter burdigaliensis]